MNHGMVMLFLIPAVAQERVWSLVSPSPVFLVPKDSSGMRERDARSLFALTFNTSIQYGIV